MPRSSHASRRARRLLLVGGAASLLPLSARAAGFQPTARDIQGPFYIAEAPWTERLNRFGQPGDPLFLAGRLRAAGSGAPLQGVLVEILQADGRGRYHPASSGRASDFADEALDLRGRLLTDPEGRFAVETLVPGAYGSRPRHWHLRLSRDGVRTLVTQLYITGEVSRGRQAGAPDRHAALAQAPSGFRYDAPDIFLPMA